MKKSEYIKILELADNPRPILVSNCCGAIVRYDTVICPACKEHFEAITEAQWEEDHE